MNDLVHDVLPADVVHSIKGYNFNVKHAFPKSQSRQDEMVRVVKSLWGGHVLGSAVPEDQRPALFKKLISTKWAQGLLEEESHASVEMSKNPTAVRAAASYKVRVLLERNTNCTSVRAVGEGRRASYIHLQLTVTTSRASPKLGLLLSHRRCSCAASWHH